MYDIFEMYNEYKRSKMTPIGRGIEDLLVNRSSEWEVGTNNHGACIMHRECRVGMWVACSLSNFEISINLEDKHLDSFYVIDPKLVIKLPKYDMKRLHKISTRVKKNLVCRNSSGESKCLKLIEDHLSGKTQKSLVEFINGNRNS